MEDLGSRLELGLDPEAETYDYDRDFPKQNGDKNDDIDVDDKGKRSKYYDAMQHLKPFRSR